MTNKDVARAFDLIADLLEIDGANRFRVNSYRNAARAIKNLTDDVAKLSESDRLEGIPGVGKSMAQHIRDYLNTGTIDVLEELQAKLPPGLPNLLQIPNLGPKKVIKLHEELGVVDLASLKQAITEGKVAQLSGFGETSAKRLEEGIEFLEKNTDRTPLGIALPLAEGLVEKIRALPGVRRVEIAGSARRGAETVGDVDILCQCDEGEDVVQAFVQFEEVEKVLASGKTKGSVLVGLPTGRLIQVDLRAVPAESFGAALQYFTGSKEHNVRLREMAARRQWRLNEYGLHDGERSIAGAEEIDIYKALGLPWIPPELRQDRDEFSPGFEADALVDRSDLRGDLHLHTVASDGRNTIEEMAQAAKQLGYDYLAICDHSKSSTVANGLSIERMERHIRDIRAADERVKGITLLVGCECDILRDGSMDYPDEILAQCDWVVASIHSAMGKGGAGKLSPTERTLAAMDNPYVNVIGHPTGRLINRREPMDLDIPRVVEQARATGTALEINASWQRLDLKDEHARQALEAGVTLSINTDAHSTEEFARLRYGLLTARRAGAKKTDILNTFTLARLRKFVQAKRSR